MTYREKLQDPRWQNRRWEILERDDYECQRCHTEDRTLHVHHLRYLSKRDPWDYADQDLITLCHICHEVVGTDTPEDETRNLWITYENIKRHIQKDMHPEQYTQAIRYLCERINT